MNKKEEINSILLVNWYLLRLQLDKDCCKERQKIARNYLTSKISKALSNNNFKTINNKNSNKQKSKSYSLSEIKLKDHQ